MQGGVKDNLARVFSILPEERIEQAVNGTLQRLKSVETNTKAVLKWCDFDERGRFVRGGATDLSDYMVKMVSAPADDPELETMARDVADGFAEPGRVTCNEDGTRFTLFLPDRVSTPQAAPVPRIRGFIVDFQVFKKIHLTFQSESRLTDAEMRVAFQLLAGITLRHAASLDDVTVETKRAQIKTAAAKMQCSGQLDLVRLLMGQLSIISVIADDEMRHASFAETFISEKLGRDARLVVERLGNGQILRCVEAGPADGIPVVVLHGMMFGMLLSGAAEHLKTEGLRLLMPLRRGYLDARPMLDLAAGDSLVEESYKDLNLFLERRAMKDVTLLGHSLGAVLALHYARRFPERLSQLVLLSANTAGADTERDSYADILYGGYKTLGEGTSLSRAITLEFSRHYPDQATAKTMLDRMFNASPADLSAMEGLETATPVHAWFPDLYRSSVAGISDDYDFVMGARLPEPITQITARFIHGTEDPLTPVGTIRTLVEKHSPADISTISGAGHFAPASHAEQVWRLVAEQVRHR